MRAISKGEDPRSDQRSHVFLMAVLSWGAGSCPVRVRNLSVHGALLEGCSLPAEKEVVTLRRGSLAMKGQIAWSAGQQCGIRFAGAINVHDWVERAGPIGQQRIDAAVAEHRAKTVANLSPPVRWSNAPETGLSPISERLLQACERISELPGMSVELAEELLKIEAAAHELRDLGNSGQ